jgi:hypothetical protein
MKAISVPGNYQVNSSCTDSFKKGSITRTVTRDIGRYVVVLVDPDNRPTALSCEPLAVLSLTSYTQPCADAIR